MQIIIFWWKFLTIHYSTLFTFNWKLNFFIFVVYVGPFDMSHFLVQRVTLLTRQIWTANYTTKRIYSWKNHYALTIFAFLFCKNRVQQTQIFVFYTCSTFLVSLALCFWSFLNLSDQAIRFFVGTKHKTLPCNWTWRSIGKKFDLLCIVYAGRFIPTLKFPIKNSHNENW